jgi:hypothetical protein
MRRVGIEARFREPEAADLPSDCGVDVPLVGHTLEDVLPAILEVDAGPGNKILDRSRNEHFVWPCETGDPCPDVNGNARNIVTQPFNLTGVDSGPHLQPYGTHLVLDLLGTLDSPRWTIKGRQESVACRVDFHAPKAIQLGTQERVMQFQQLSPAAVAHFGGAIGGADDVREEHRRQKPVGCQCHTVAGQELPDLA